MSELLHFSRPHDPARRETNLQCLIDETAYLVQSTANAKGIDITIEVSAELPLLWIDADQIKQALLNLMINACQSMPMGGTLRISATRKGECVEVSVCDTGIGMSSEQIRNLFNPFYTTKEEGTGLGLAISHALIEKHKGRIDVTSELNLGSVFTIVLPCLEVPTHGV